MVTALAPIEEKRKALLAEMSPELRLVVKDFEEKDMAAAVGPVMIAYDKGARIKRIIEQEAKFGTNAVEQLAAYFGVSATKFYELRNFASEWDKNFLKAELKKPMSNGDLLSYDHFRNLVRIKSSRDQTKLLRQVRLESMSSNSLSELISAQYEKKTTRSGGRKPLTPSTPAAALQKAFSQSQQLSRYIDTMADGVFSKISEMAADAMDEKLLDRLHHTKEQFEAADKAIRGGLGALEKSEARVAKILNEKKQAGDAAPQKSTKKKSAKKKPAGDAPAAATKKKKKKKPEGAATKKVSKKASKKSTKKKVAKKSSPRPVAV